MFGNRQENAFFTSYETQTTSQWCRRQLGLTLKSQFQRVFVVNPGQPVMGKRVPLCDTAVTHGSLHVVSCAGRLGDVQAA